MNRLTYAIIFIILVIVSIGIYHLPLVTESIPVNINTSLETLNKQAYLNIPPLLEYKEIDGKKIYNLVAQKSTYEFLNGVKSDTYGFNGNILGPTIRFSKGDHININVQNNLDQQTTTHWHGAIVPGSADGGVHNIIDPDTTWLADFNVIQQAATLWYHPHQHEETANQVYKGLSGMIIVDDENSRNLNIPSEYGIDDIPIILQSKNLDANGRLLPLNHTNHHLMSDGFIGNTLLTNAQIHPKIDVNTNQIRLRILNASQGEVYNIKLSNNYAFSVIASDGGFYNELITLSELNVGPANRYEIIIDLDSMEGEKLELIANNVNVLTININDNLNEKYILPERLNSLIDVDKISKIDREFVMKTNMMGVMGMMGSGRNKTGNMNHSGSSAVTINGQSFDMNRIDFKAKSGTVEYWEIKNLGGAMSTYHPFHVHATQFSIISINGKEPNALLQGRHDTINLYSNDTAIIAVPFDESLNGVFMYHCHILDHEDAGMMGQFELVN